MSTTFAQSLGRVGAGVGAAYVLSREFDILDSQQFAYRPGNQLLLRGALDVLVGPAAKLAIQATIQRSSDDQVNGRNLYRSGNRQLVTASYTFPSKGGGNGTLYGGFLYRAHGVFLLEVGRDAPSEELFIAGGLFRLPIRGAVLRPDGDIRIVRRADGSDQGYVIDVGNALEIRLASGVTVVPAVRVRFGNVLVHEGVETGFTGFDLGFTLRFPGSS